ncbi:hypothetical protein [Agromyces marinus]|uniref:hypothetical protein n=1 Tax=Agromyces marinus TaxID=1389020 RepID=UPI001F364516|nr:hypothetical protein [Agromyces marinus]
MNTTLTIQRSSAQHAAAGAGERLARRLGLALLTWSSAAEARRSRVDLARAAELRRDANLLREENFATLARLARTL